MERHNKANFSSEEFANHPYTILADMNFAIYLTTNYDTLIEAALIIIGKKALLS
jgi:hypothetical protein